MGASENCSTGQYRSSIDNRCHLCSSGCLECTEEGCNKCQFELELTSASTCHYPINIETNSNKVNCHPNCLTCYDTKVDTCLSCKPNLDDNSIIFRNFTTCIKVATNTNSRILDRSSVCGKGLVLTDEGSCDICPLNCSKCKLNPNKDIKFKFSCLACTPNFSLNNDTFSCQLTPSPSPSHFPISNSTSEDNIKPESNGNWYIPLLITIFCLIGLFVFIFIYRKVATTYRKVKTERKVAEYRGNLINNMRNDINYNANRYDERAVDQSLL